MTRFEPIAAVPHGRHNTAPLILLEHESVVLGAETRVDHADWGTGPIDLGHVLAGDLTVLREIIATPGRAHYSRVGPRRRGPRRSSYQTVGGRDAVIPKLRQWRLEAHEQLLTLATAAAALVAATSWAMASLQGMVPL